MTAVFDYTHAHHKKLMLRHIGGHPEGFRFRQSLRNSLMNNIGQVSQLSSPRVFAQVSRINDPTPVPHREAIDLSCFRHRISDFASLRNHVARQGSEF